MIANILEQICSPLVSNQEFETISKNVGNKNCFNTFKTNFGQIILKQGFLKINFTFEQIVLFIVANHSRYIIMKKHFGILFIFEHKHYIFFLIGEQY